MKPSDIRLRRKARLVEFIYPDGGHHALTWEFLRVHSPSAEVRGHHPAQALLQTGKKNVAVTDIRPVGHYALQLVFDDGHDSGLYTWEYLEQLCLEADALWERYLERLAAEGGSREPDAQVLRFPP